MGYALTLTWVGNPWTSVEVQYRQLAVKFGTGLLPANRDVNMFLFSSFSSF